MESREVELSTALAQPQRIGAVYFVNEGAAINDACGSFAGCPNGGYREYFVNNERMIEEWSLGTETIRDEIERSSRVVSALLDWTAETQMAVGSCSFASSAVCRWLDEMSIVPLSGAQPESPWAEYNMALALTSDFYASTAENMRALLDTCAPTCWHLMVGARSHVEHVHQLDWLAYAGMQQLAHAACGALQRLLQPERVFVASLGRSVSMSTSYAHLHVHDIPVYECDERARPARVLAWSEGVVVYDDDEARVLIAQLRAALRA